MPHMANLPWMNAYITLFLIMMLVFMSFSLLNKINLVPNMQSTKMKKNLKWLW